MARLENESPKNGKKIIIIDDHKDYLEITSKLLQRNGYEVICYNERNKITEYIINEDPDLLILDYFMPGSISCEQFIEKIRGINPYLQILLQTGYAGELPPRDILKILDIQGFYDKTTGPENLLLWVDSGIKISGMIKNLKKTTDILNREITERKIIEEQLLAERKSLEKIVNDRTIEILTKNNQLEKEISEKIDRENKYRILIENIPQKVFVKDKNLNFISCNMAYMKDCGLTDSDEIFGKNDFDFFSDEESRRNREEDARIMENGVTEEYDDMRFIDGAEIWTRKIKIPLKFNNVESYGILCIFWDITDFKKNESRKLIDEFRYKSLLELNHLYESGVSDLLDFALNTGISITKSKIGYIYFYDEVTEKFTNYAWSKDVMEQCKVINPKTEYDLKQCGLWGEVVRQRKAIVTNDYDAENIFKKGIPEGHVSLKRHLAIPVFKDNKLVATIGVGNKSDNYDEYDVQNLTYIMDEVWKLISRKEIEEQIRENEEEFGNIFKQAAVGICYTSLDGSFMKLNRKFCDIVGYDEEDLKKQNFNEIIYLSDVYSDFEKINDMIDDKISISSAEKRLVKKDGSLVWVNLTVSLSSIFANKERYIITIIEDISQRKLAEETVRQYQDHLEEMIGQRTEQLRESEFNFRNLFETSPVAIGMYHTDNRILMINKKFTDLFGYELQDIPDVNSWYEKAFTDEIYRKDFREKWKLNYEKARLENSIEIAPLESQVTCKDGTLLYIQFNESIIGETNIISFTDLTARKNFEDALKTSENKYRMLAEEINDGIFAADIKGNLTYANKSMANILGFEQASDLTGKSYVEFMPKNENLSSTDFEKAAKKRSIEDIYEIEIRKKNGSITYLEIKPVMIFSGEMVTGFRGVVRDISERKTAEMELQKTLNELKRSNSELEQFAYIASHDLQEPLRVISSYLQLLEKRTMDKLDDGSRDFITRVINASIRMQNMINDLLEYSRITLKKKPFKLCDFNEIVKISMENIKIAISSKNATINCGNLPRIFADETQMVRVFQNLIGNAVKFNRENINLEISISAENKEGIWIFGIKDNGIGIEKEFCDRIFQIFQRLHTRDKYPGNGIGLASCKKIIDRHHGEIWVESEFEKGSVFYFSLPENLENIG